jgi:tripartite-type tricarboxylate transporter receptor subunit TctC
MAGVSVWALLTFTLLLSPAQAGYPERTVKIVVPYAAGGGADLLARILAQELSLRTKGQFIVENRTGGGTVVGTRAVVDAKPDGYTLLMTQTSLPISAAVVPGLGYDVRRDLSPIVNVALGPNGLFVHRSVPATTLQEFLAYAKSNPGKLSYSSGGSATVSHLVGESLKTLAGIDLVHVPTRGMGPALVDLVAGHVQATFGSMAASLQEARNGGIRLLAVAERKRTRWSPDVPTIEEKAEETIAHVRRSKNFHDQLVETFDHILVQICRSQQRGPVAGFESWKPHLALKSSGAHRTNWPSASIVT